jgi:hypothetical protein
MLQAVELQDRDRGNRWWTVVEEHEVDDLIHEAASYADLSDIDNVVYGPHTPEPIRRMNEFLAGMPCAACGAFDHQFRVTRGWGGCEAGRAYASYELSQLTNWKLLERARTDLSPDEYIENRVRSGRWI